MQPPCKSDRGKDSTANAYNLGLGLQDIDAEKPGTEYGAREKRDENNGGLEAAGGGGIVEGGEYVGVCDGVVGVDGFEASVRSVSIFFGRDGHGARWENWSFGSVSIC